MGGRQRLGEYIMVTITNKASTISTDELKNIIKESKSYNEVLRKLGYKRSGRTQTILRERVLKENIDISHFRNWNNINQQNLEDILVKNSTYNNQLLKERLIEGNLLEYKCDKCGNIGVWNNEILVLQLDHKNGINNDNRLENLRFLCPNCHSQTKTFSGKNIKNKNKNK
jgi:Zn finger protein HypA/HybF involved in hydrogenase expression